MALTPQEIFDTVKTHLLTQGRQAKLNGDMCAYHADNGDMCAAGRLIPSHLYDPTMECKTIKQVFRLYPEVAEHIGKDNLVLVEALQDLHDNNDPQYWAAELNDLAKRRELTP